MPWGYYAYIIGDDGHISNRVEVHCDNDEEAKRCAVQLLDGHAIELWQETRKVATFQPGGISQESVRTPKASILAQAADVLRRARKLPIGPARNDLRRLAQGLLKLHRSGMRADVELIQTRRSPADHHSLN
jgi:hypothetical protein